MNCVSSCWENVHAAKQKRPEDKQGFQSCVLEFTSVFFHSTDLIQEYLTYPNVGRIHRSQRGSKITLSALLAKITDRVFTCNPSLQIIFSNSHNFALAFFIMWFKWSVGLNAEVPWPSSCFQLVWEWLEGELLATLGPMTKKSVRLPLTHRMLSLHVQSGPPNMHKFGFSYVWCNV